MSRILRRPMFRGGRVDSRGTGITSGLGYEKGGSVQDRPGYFYGGLAMSGLGALGRGLMKYGVKPIKKGVDYFLEPKGGFPMKIIGGKGGTMDKYISQTMPPRTYGEFGKELATSRAGDIGRFLYKDPLVKYPANVIGGASKGIFGLAKKPLTAGALGYTGYQFKDEISDLYNKFFGDEKAGGREFVGEEAEIVGDPRDLPKEKALTTDQIKLMEMENLYKKLMEDTKKKAEGDGEESIDIDKEKFAKALGSDKARGEDISNMLLSFAGKALKPEATVKGAFGEFFEEEAKRPSSKTKIDQAAAQLAINKYIKGEISKKEAETLIKRLELQARFADERGKKSIGQYYLDSKSPSFAGRVKDAVNAAYGDEGAVADFEVTTSDKMNDPDQFTFNEDAIGIIFIETDTKKSYTFDSQGNKIKVLNG
jgi:hypothetical protein